VFEVDDTQKRISCSTFAWAYTTYYNVHSSSRSSLRQRNVNHFNNQCLKLNLSGISREISSEETATFKDTIQKNKDESTRKHDQDSHSIISKEDFAKCNSLSRLFVGQISLSHMSLKDDLKPASLLHYKSTIKLSMEQTHFLTKVMRFFKKNKKNKTYLNTITTTTGGEIDINQCVRVFDGINGEWLAQIIDPSTTQSYPKKRPQKASIHQDALEAVCMIQLRQQEEEYSNEIKWVDSSPWVLFAPIKKQRAKLLVEKCTELNTGLFCTIVTDHTDSSSLTACIGNYSDNNDSTQVMFQERKSKISKSAVIEKLPLIACEAAEQSERLTVPAFVYSLESNNSNEQSVSQEYNRQPMNINSLLDSLDSSPLFQNRSLLVCRERIHPGVVPILKAFDIIYQNTSSIQENKMNRCKGVAFLIGPEGGWSQHENDLFDAYNSKYPDSLMMCVSLGSNMVLRAETAAITAVGCYAIWSDIQRNK